MRCQSTLLAVAVLASTAIVAAAIIAYYAWSLAAASWAQPVKVISADLVTDGRVSWLNLKLSVEGARFYKMLVVYSAGRFDVSVHAERVKGVVTYFDSAWLPPCRPGELALVELLPSAPLAQPQVLALVRCRWVSDAYEYALGVVGRAAGPRPVYEAPLRMSFARTLTSPMDWWDPFDWTPPLLSLTVYLAWGPTSSLPVHVAYRASIALSAPLPRGDYLWLLLSKHLPGYYNGIPGWFTSIDCYYSGVGAPPIPGTLNCHEWVWRFGFYWDILALGEVHVHIHGVKLLPLTTTKLRSWSTGVAALLYTNPTWVAFPWMHPRESEERFLSRLFSAVEGSKLVLVLAESASP